LKKGEIIITHTSSGMTMGLPPFGHLPLSLREGRIMNNFKKMKKIIIKILLIFSLF